MCPNPFEEFDKVVQETFASKTHRTLEEALEQALEMTTPEHPGVPREHPKHPSRQPQGNTENEWL